jgi:acyl-coenzyme A thioesterase PaaI-like protein
LIAQHPSQDHAFGALIKTSGSITIRALTAKELPNNSFVERMASKETYKEITSWPRKLNTPHMLNVTRRTWIERSGNPLISVFYLSRHHAGYCNLVHGGMLAALIDDVSAEYCNYAAPSLYALTRSQKIEFEKPSPLGAFFLAKVSTSREFPFDINNSRTALVECEIWTAPGDDKLAMVVKAKTLFVLRESLPKLSTGEAQHSIEDVLVRT